METIFTLNLNENLIEKLADFLKEKYLKNTRDLSRIACVFGGRRPALFLKKELSKRIGSSFIPPQFFSIDDFISFLADKQRPWPLIKDLDNYYLIYALARKEIKGLIKAREGFAEFMPWAREIVSFIEQLDLELIDDSALNAIEKSAEIGYEIPENINKLLADIVRLRCIYHKELEKRNLVSRGIKYRQASRSIKEISLDDFDKIIFCNFFYLHKSEQEIIKSLLDKGKGMCFFQGSENDWSVLAKNARYFKTSIKPDVEYKKRPGINLYQGFDTHSQLGILRHILETKIKSKHDTLIVVPRPDTIISLMSEISCSLDEFNVSMGYPFKRSAVYELFDLVLRAQLSRKGSLYYSRDYLSVLKHPLVIGFSASAEDNQSGILAQEIGKCLSGEEDSSLGGCLFVSLDEIESENVVLSNASLELELRDYPGDKASLKQNLQNLHALFFRNWEEVNDFRNFAQKLKSLIVFFLRSPLIFQSPFNVKAVNKLQDIADELTGLIFAHEQFKSEEIWEIFEQRLQGEKISFKGSPLRGTQILGLFETRSLSFENVIIMDMNESVMPKLKIYEPLIPREVMLSLGLNRLEKEEEIQRYQFMSLITSAKTAHLIYSEDQVNEKSRFIEELLWFNEKKDKKINAINIPRACYSLQIKARHSSIGKTPEVLQQLRQSVYSASRVNTYLNCPLQFYYRYVLGLKEKEDLLENPQASCIGSFIHQLLEEAFRRFKGREPVLDSAFKKYFFELMDEKFEREISRRMRSDAFLLKQIIKVRLEKFIELEQEREVDKILCLEEERRGKLNVNGREIDFVYTIDRIDELKDSSLLIIDYKTGGSDLAPKSADSLLSMDRDRLSIKDNLKSFQLPIYYFFLSEDFPARTLNAQLYNIRTLQRKNFISEDDFNMRHKIKQACLDALFYILEEIFDPDKDFTAHKDERLCRYCSFSGFCI
ncbi:MAG: PD-(D/E)XK nuclease family protein [Candidatus Omnitrophica bacterium]|nr:PD-(D/E)XK nuclease family protein [Candidatus Omnitrophota bacterium]